MKAAHPINTDGLLHPGEDGAEVSGSAATVPFDDRCHPHASLGDLSRLLIRQHLQEAGTELQHEATRVPMDVLGRRMNVVGDATGALLPKNAGLLFFNDRPHEFLAGTHINVVCFPDGADGRIEEEEFRGPLAAILRKVVSYIDGGFLRVRVVKYPHRPEADRFWNYPPAAIEETLGNAVFHRSYEEREPVEVRITPNEILVQSCPGPHCSIRMDDLQRGQAASCCYRNPRIGEFLEELNLAKCGATGVPRILRAMRNNGSPPPRFQTDDGPNWLLVRLPFHPSFAPDAYDAGRNQRYRRASSREGLARQRTGPSK